MRIAAPGWASKRKGSPNEGSELETATITTYEVGDRVDDFELPDLAGEPRRLSEIAGDWTPRYLTTTWCPDCTAEAPFLETEVAEPFRDHGLGTVVVRPRGSRGRLSGAGPQDLGIFAASRDLGSHAEEGVTQRPIRSSTIHT